jgi:hypothetical protein
VGGSFGPGSGLDGGDEMREVFEEAFGAEVVGHVEERELYAVWEGVVVREVGAEFGLEALEDGG